MDALHVGVAHVAEGAIKKITLLLCAFVGSALAKVAHGRDQKKTVNQKGPKEGPEQSHVDHNSEPEFC